MQKTYLCINLTDSMKENRKISNIYLGVLTFLGLFGALTVQAVWLYNTYILTKNNIRKESYDVIEKALEEEGNIRFGKTPKGTEIMSGPTNDTIPAMTYFYEQLSDMGYPLSLHDLDSITSDLLQEKGIKDSYFILIMNLRNGLTLDSCGKQKDVSWMAIKPKYFPIRSDYTQVVQLVIANPYKTFMERMGLLIVATLIIIVVVVGCIIHQIRIIVRMKKIFQIREDFSYAMVHDMKSPLSSIFSIMNLLHSGRLDDKPELRENYYRIAEGEANHLLALTNKVLTLSKLESRRLEMNRQAVPLAPMMEELVEKFKAKAGKPVRFTLDLQVAEAYADGEYLVEVVSNLIDNAVKYSGESVDIRISSADEADYTLIKVRDNGLGISEKDQRIIFNKYERGAAMSRTRKGGATGFGLGLNFVRQVVEAHGGNVVVDSIKGEFSEFVIYLPKKHLNLYDKAFTGGG